MEAELQRAVAEDGKVSDPVKPGARFGGLDGESQEALLMEEKEKRKSMVQEAFLTSFKRLQGEVGEGDGAGNALASDGYRGSCGAQVP